MAEDRAEARAEREDNRRREQAVDAVLRLHHKHSGVFSDLCVCCGDHYPSPTRNLLAPVSWREKYEASR